MSYPVGWNVPEAAYTRRWGVAGPGPASRLGDPEAYTGEPSGLRNLAGGLSVPGLGIPLGGVGAGSFQYNLFGTFGPWSMGGSRSSEHWESRTLTQAALHVREASQGRPAIMRTLALGHDNVAPQRRFEPVCSAWSTLSPGDGSYSALFPFGWTRYDVFRSDVAVRFWSPIVAGEDDRTSAPVAFFDVEVSNPSDEPIELSVMFSFPNVPAHSSEPRRRDASDASSPIFARFDRDESSGVVGVTLGTLMDEESSSVASEWTIAALPGAGQRASHVTSWDAAGSGADLRDALSESGDLPDDALDESRSAGALAISVHLHPGASEQLRFALAWDFPQVVYRGGEPIPAFPEVPNGGEGTRTAWMRRYTEFYGAAVDERGDFIPGSYPGGRGFAIAVRELARHEDSLRAVERWWRPLAENPEYPAWLRGAALNELYELVFNAAFWEAGLVETDVAVPAGGPRLGSEIPGTRLFYFVDSGSGGASANEMDMDSAGYLAYTKLFPHIEIGRIRAWLQLVKQNPEGRVPQQILPGTGPYIGATAGIQGEPADSPTLLGQPPEDPSELGELFDPRGGNSFRDVGHKLIHRTYALAAETDDDDLLAYAYPTLMKVLRRVRLFNPPGSLLPSDPPSNNPPNTMDQIPVDGHGIYNCMLHVLSLQLMSRATSWARRLGVPEAIAETETALEQELQAAKAEFETIFWNAETGRYRFCDGSGGITGRVGRIHRNLKLVPPPDAVFVDAFYAQAVASQLGMPPLIDLGRARTHWNNTIDAFLAPLGPDGERTGPPTMLDEHLGHYRMDHFEGGGVLPETSEVIPGCAWMGAAAAISIARDTGDSALEAKALEMARSVAARIYDDGGATTRGMAFATPESWFVDDLDIARYSGYTRNRSIWQVMDAIRPLDVIRAR